LRDLTITYPGIAADVLLPEHHGSATPHKAKVPFLHPLGGEGQKQDLGDGVVLIPVEIPAEQCIHGESPLSHRVTQTLSSLDGEHPHLQAASRLLPDTVSMENHPRRG